MQIKFLFHQQNFVSKPHFQWVVACIIHDPISGFFFSTFVILKIWWTFFFPKKKSKIQLHFYTWKTNTHFSKFFPFFFFLVGNKNHLFQSQQFFVLFNLIFFCCFFKSKILISHKKLKLQICFNPLNPPPLQTLNFEINFDPKTPTQKQKQWFS